MKKNSTSKNRKKGKAGVAEKIMKVLGKQPMAADEIRRELKDRFGHVVKPNDIRVNLLYLLRREEVERKKIDKIYKYHT